MAEITKTSQLSKGIYVTAHGTGLSILSYTDVDELYVGNKKVKSVWSHGKLVWPVLNVSAKLTYNIILDCVAQMQISIVLSSNIKDLQCRIDNYSCTSSSHTDNVTDIKAISTGKLYCQNNSLLSFQPCAVNLGTSSLSYKPTISIDYSVNNVDADINMYYTTTLNPTITFPTLNYTNYIYLRLYNSALNVSQWWSIDYLLLVGTSSNILGDQEYSIGTDYITGTQGVSKISSNELPFGNVSDLSPYQLSSYNTEVVCFNKMLVCRIPRSKQCLVVQKVSELQTSGGQMMYNCLVNTGSSACSSVNYINVFYNTGSYYKRLCVISSSTKYVYGTLNDIKTLS